MTVGSGTACIALAAARASFAVLAACAVLTGCGRAEAPIPTDVADAPSRAAFVGSEVCASCHAAETERWQGSHHDLAMQPATPESVLGDFEDAEYAAHGVSSRFSTRDGRYFVRTDGPDGVLADFEVTHTFGVFPLQQYLVAFPDGRRQALDLAWDARPAGEGGQRWFHLYESDERDVSDPLHWTGSAQTWNTRCAACHSTALEKGYDPDRQRFETRWVDIDVGCEACHGPGARHAASPTKFSLRLGLSGRAWVRDDEAATARLVISAAAPLPPGDAATANATRRRDAEVEICAQCHARRAQLDDALAPGEPLLDRFIPALLDEGLYYPDGQILDEVFVYGSFVQSAMYRAGVTCSDCHEPHAATLVVDGNALCTRCHAPKDFDTPRHHRHQDNTAGAFCVDCHMRAETYMVVDPRHDHSFRVPRPDLSVRLGTPNACTDCHVDEGPAWAAERLREWYPAGRSGHFHYADALAAGRAWSAERAALLQRVVDDHSLPAIARATAIRLLAEQADAEAAERISAALEDPDPLVQLAGLGALEALPPERRAALGQRFLTHELRALRITAARVLAPVRMRLSERRRADLDSALNERFAVQRYNSDSAEAWLDRGSLEAALGRVIEAEAAYQEAIRREPSFGSAYVNLADLYRGLGREADAEAAIRKGIAESPDDAALHYALGLSLVRSGRPKAALPELERAAALAAGEPLYRYAAGLALASSEHADAAIAALEAAYERFPGYAPTLVALATLHRDAGRPDRALPYVRRLLEVSPSDPGARALLAQLESIAGAH